MHFACFDRLSMRESRTALDMLVVPVSPLLTLSLSKRAPPPMQPDLRDVR
jgi:hypothetical protein